MSLLDLGALRAAPVTREPFEFTILANFVAERELARHKLSARVKRLVHFLRQRPVSLERCVMSNSQEIEQTFHRCLDNSRVEAAPYRHWLLQDMFPGDVCEDIATLPFAAADIGDTEGKRETHNSMRVFFSEENQSRFAVCRAMTEALHAPATVRKLERTCDIDLTGSYLRIEYCQDTDGFWLESHKDIPVKLFTMLLYLSSGPEAAGWGTDIYDADGYRVRTAPFAMNRGLIFIPGNDTWHGFERRPIRGVRKSLIVNYVTAEWRARHELCCPDRPIA